MSVKILDGTMILRRENKYLKDRPFTLQPKYICDSLGNSFYVTFFSYFRIIWSVTMDQIPNASTHSSLMVTRTKHEQHIRQIQIYPLLEKANNRLKYWNDETLIFWSPCTKNISQFSENEELFYNLKNKSKKYRSCLKLTSSLAILTDGLSAGNSILHFLVNYN